ncbi:alpha/beta hydrolase [Halalkalirubrum salinum]|uniref:alpha/beta hydrolase n=1 Tax=Halalkalirubrum salinum TaxID=2563889 RepID=UPI0010FB9C74|nr:alpha/beta hydrolase [Halalkalirubrum salinum]
MNGERIAVWLVVLVCAAAAGGLLAADAYSYDANPEQVTAVEAGDDVVVERDNRGYTIASGPVTEATTGIVYYPGALVDPESYIPTLAPLAAERDVLIVVPTFPLELAIADVDRADSVRADYPAIDQWVVGGHSLGGAAACRYAAETDDLDGLVLHAAYCDVDISNRSLPTLSVQGSNDEVINADAERAARSNLPAEATIVTVEGMTHAQFGAYGPQRGDGSPAVDDATARDRLTEEWERFLDRVLERS